MNGRIHFGQAWFHGYDADAPQPPRTKKGDNALSPLRVRVTTRGVESLSSLKEKGQNPPARQSF